MHLSSVDLSWNAPNTYQGYFRKMFMQSTNVVSKPFTERKTYASNGYNALQATTVTK